MSGFTMPHDINHKAQPGKRPTAGCRIIVIGFFILSIVLYFISTTRCAQQQMTTGANSTVKLDSPSAQPIALVYKGPGTSCCSDSLAQMIKNDSKWKFDVRFVGPNETLSVEDGLALPGVKLYAQPGATGDVRKAYNNQKGDTEAIKTFVNNGGRFLGICMGGYMMGSYGFDIIPNGDAQQYISSQGAEWTSASETSLNVTWRGTQRPMFFQDGNYFDVEETPGVMKLSTYANGLTAAMVAPAGLGKVGGSGPHPELSGAGASKNQDLGNDLIDTLME